MTSETRIHWIVTWRDDTGDSKVVQPVGPLTQDEVATWVANHDETAKWTTVDLEPLPSVNG